MNTRIKGKIRNNGLSIHNNQYVQLHLVLDGGAHVIEILRESDNVRIPVDGTNTHHIRDNGGNVRRPDTVEFIRIKFKDAKTANDFARLVILKDLIKNNNAAEIGQAIGGGTQDTTNWKVTMRGLRYNTTDAATNDFSDENDFGLFTDGDHVLALDSEHAYKNGATRDDFINIDDQDFDTPANGYSYKLITDEYWKLVELLDDIEKMLKGDENLNTTKINGWIGELRTYVINTNVAKYFLYNTANFGGTFGNRYFQTKIQSYHKTLWELKLWQEFGYSNVKQVLKANANGFRINDRGGTGGNQIIGDGALEGKNLADGLDNAAAATNIGNIKKVIKNTLYKGFKMIHDDQDDSKIVDQGGSDNNVSILGKRAEESTLKQAYKRAAIDNFCDSFGTKPVVWGSKKDYRGFQPVIATTYRSTTPSTDDKLAADITYRIGTGYDILAATKRRGRIDKNVTEFNKGDNDTNRPNGYEHKQLTKTCFDILQAGDLDTANAGVIDLMLKSDYDGEGTGQKKKVLKMMMVCAQCNAAVAYGTNAGNAKKVNEAYDEGDNFLTYFDVDYRSMNKVSDGAKLQKAKTELTKYLNPGPSETLKKKISAFWESEDGDDGKRRAAITNKINEIDNVLQGNNSDWRTQLNNLKQEKTADGSGNLVDNSGFHKAFWAQVADSDIQNEDNFKALVALTSLLDNCYGDNPTTKKSDLQVYSASNASDDKKKAYELVKDFTHNNKKWWDDALSNVGDDTIDLAQVKLDALASLKKDLPSLGEEAFNLMIKDNADLKTKPQIEKVVEIFKKCHEAWKKQADDKGVREALDGYVSGSSTEWKAVNQFKKNHKGEKCDEGFATGAQNYLKEFIKNRQEKVKASGVTTANSAQTAKDALEKLKKETDNTIKDTVIPRVELMIALFEKNNGKATELATIIRDNFLEKLETDYDDSTFKDNLTILEDKLAELNKYKDGEHKSVYESLGQNEKDKLDALIKSVQDKVTSMQAAKKAAENNDDQTSGEAPWYKKWWGILGIIAGIALVLGLIAYFVKSNSNEEGEGESE